MRADCVQYDICFPHQARVVYPPQNIIDTDPCATCTSFKRSEGNKMNLYLVSTENLGDYYIVAAHPTAAEGTLIDLLNKADYGFQDYRKVINIKLLAELLPDLNGKPFFSSGKRLIL